jgi:hypothetical protein
MVRRSFLFLVALAAPAGAFAQAPAAGKTTAGTSARPESILPKGTLLYVGTDDLDALVQRTKSSPMGKILVEQEVKDFLAKPLGELRKALDQGIAMAKQQPGLESIDLDVDKILAGPYGRAFVAMTQFDLSFKEGRPDPTALDVGLVFGLEPRAGAVDVFALLKQVVTQVAASATHGELKFEPVTVEGLTYERMQNPAAAVSLCFATVGGMPIVSLSEKALAAIARTAKDPASSLQADPDFARCVAAVGAPASGDIVVFSQLGRIVELGGKIAVAALASSDKKDIAAIVEKGLAASKLASIGPSYATSQRKGDTSINISYSEIDPKAGGLLALASSKPVDLELIKTVPKNAIAFSLGSVEIAPVWDTIVATLKDAAPEQHDQVMGMLKGFEAQLGGADAQGNPNWTLRRDLLGVLGGRMMSMTVPSAGSLLGPGGDTVGWIESSNPEQLEKSLALVLDFADKQLADNEGLKIKFKEQAYGDVKLKVLDTSKLGMFAMAAGSMQPTWCIKDGRLWFGMTTKALKKALDGGKPAAGADPAAPPPENILAKADFSKRWVEPPAGSVVTSVSYSDTATIFENTYQQLMSVVVPMLSSTGVLKDVPIDISALPSAEAITQHLFGTVSVSYRVGDHAHLTQSRGPFGPETAFVMGGLVAGVAAMVAYHQEQSAHGEHHAAATGKSRAKGDPAKKMDADFADLGASITVYIITNNKPPASLDDLTKPAPPDYPKGYTQGQPLPIDPWGHAYAYSTDGKDDYKIWSIGPNGIDEHGAGDDVSPKR